MTIKIQKIGNSLGIHIPKKIVSSLSLSKGAELTIEERDHGIFITPTKEETLESLLAQVTPENTHQIIEFGDPIGKEII